MSRYSEKTDRENFRQPRLPALDIELTERCNNDCLHCCINRPADDIEAKEREMTTAQIQRHLEEAAELGCLQVRFTGGEPLLRDDFETLYLHARWLGMRVLLFTNARLITPDVADLLARVPPLVEIEVSVYGMTPESYDAVTRRMGAFREFRGGLEALSQRQVPFIVKWVVLPPNFDELGSFKAWAMTIPWIKRPPSVSAFLQLRNRRDSESRNHVISSLRLDPEKTAAVKTLDAVGERLAMRQFCRQFLRSSDDHLFSCGLGDVPCLDAYGRLQPCMGIRVPELTYDLGKGSLHDALSTFFPALREQRALNVAYLQRCARCLLKGLCEQCPAQSWIEHGRLDQPVEYLCDLAHEQARRLGLLGSAEKGWEVADGGERIRRLEMAST